MPNYVTAQEVVNFLRILDSTGAILTIGAGTDPTSTQVEEAIDNAESEFENRIGHAWTAKTVTNEVHDITNPYDWLWGTPIHLQNRNVRTIASGSGDKIEIWDGTNWQDKTSSENSTWRMNYQLGILYLMGYTWSIGRENRVRITYRYGDTSIPDWVKKAIKRMVALELIETSLSLSKIQTQEGVNINQLMERWEKDIERIVANNQEVKVIEF